MADAKILSSGGDPVPSPILVAVDGVTVLGDGSLRSPLRSAAAPAVSVARLAPTELTGAEIDPTIDVTFISWGGDPLVELTTCVVNLPAGEADGDEVTVTFDGTENLRWRVDPVGGTNVKFDVAGDDCGGVFVWSASQAGWYLKSEYLGTY